MTPNKTITKAASYARYATYEQTGEAERKAILEKKIFRTLKNYSHGFYANNSSAEIKLYDEKVKALKERILADVEHAPEIIAEEFATYQARMYRAQMTGYYVTLKCDAEWKAIDNVCMALLDAKPFKATRKN